MSHELREGVELSAIYFGGEEGSHYKVGVMGCFSIIVAEQLGQIGMVPWAKVSVENEPIHLVNLASVELVTFKETP